MSTLSIYVFLVLFRFCTASLSCEYVALSPNSSVSLTKLCIFEATKQGRLLAIIVYFNRTCQVCGQKAATSTQFRTGRYSKLTSPLLMFRSHASSGISVYETFMTGPLNSSAVPPENLRRTTAWFKSSLFDSTKLLSISEVQLELLHDNGTLAVKLGFGMSGTHLQEEKAWFDKSNLRSAFPWNVTEMKNDNYNFFSMRGLQTALSHRRFYINICHYGCPKNNGYLLITGSVIQCDWEKGVLNNPPYLWNPDPKKGPWQGNLQQAAEFRISAVIGAENERVSVYYRH